MSDTEQKTQNNNDPNEEKESSPIVKTLAQLDRIIGTYYVNMDKGNIYYSDITNKKDGKFKRFVDENQFDDEDMEDEFANDDDVTDCSYLDFDGGTFPFNPPLENVSDRSKKLYFFLKYCYLKGKHPTILSDPNTINFNMVDLSMNKNEIESIKNLYTIQCPTICQQVALAADNNMIYALLIGYNNNIPFLQYLTDIFQRDRLQLKLQNQSNDEYKDIDVVNWCSKNKFIQHILNNYEKGEKIVNMLKHAIPSYMARIQPQFQIESFIGFDKIKDDIWQVARYFQAAAQFIQFLLRQNIYASTLPLQFDFVIAVKEAIQSGQPLEVPRDSSDDSDSNDMNSYSDDECDTEKYYDCIGSIKEKLNGNKLLNECGIIDQQENKLEEVRHVTRLVTETYNKFKHNMMKKCEGYPKNKRIICVIDRRKYITKYKGKIPRIKLQFQKRKDIGQIKDEIIFFNPPNNANNLPNMHLPEIYFNNLKQCLIPNFDYSDCKIEYTENDSKQNNNYNELDQTKNYLINKKVISNITSHEACNGGLITFSFNIEQEDEIKCYLWWQGKCIRFLPSDIVDILTQLFDETFYRNKKFNKNERAVKEMVTSIRYKDVHFNNWFKKISILRNPSDNLKKYIIPDETLKSPPKYHQNY